MNDTRREFLLKLAKGAAYAAPVVSTLATPDGLLGQGQSGTSPKGKGKGKGGGGGGKPAPGAISKLDVRLSAKDPKAPWAARPPGTPPGRMP